MRFTFIKNVLHSRFGLLVTTTALLSFGVNATELQYKPVPTAVVLQSSNIQSRVFPGEVRVFRRVDLGFNVSGQLEFLNAVEGTHVGKGELIARLDSRDFQYRFDMVNASFRQSEIEYHRKQKLFEDAVISQSEFDRVEAAYHSAKAQLDIAKKALNDTSLHAPFDAVIAKRFIENFEQVSSKKTVISLHDIREIDVVINIPEALMARAQVENLRSIEVTFDADTTRAFPAEIREYRLSPNPVTRTYEVIVKLDSPESLNVFSGMSAMVAISQLDTTKNGEALLVPIQSVFSKGNSSFVWVVPEKGGNPEKRKVDVLAINGGMMEVFGDLVAGERVARAGVHTLSETLVVRPSREKKEGLTQ